MNGGEGFMVEKGNAKDKLFTEREKFYTELKIFVNQKLYEKNIITEDMYWSAKEQLLKTCR